MSKRTFKDGETVEVNYPRSWLHGERVTIKRAEIVHGNWRYYTKPIGVINGTAVCTALGGDHLVRAS